jgi:hypothetical protein
MRQYCLLSDDKFTDPLCDSAYHVSSHDWVFTINLPYYVTGPLWSWSYCYHTATLCTVIRWFALSLPECPSRSIQPILICLLSWDATCLLQGATYYVIFNGITIASVFDLSWLPGSWSDPRQDTCKHVLLEKATCKTKQLFHKYSPS